MTNSPYPKTIEMISKWDINPDTVSVDGFSEKGYYKFVFEIIDGKKRKIVMPDGTAARTFQPWPRHCDGTIIYKQFIAEGGEGFTIGDMGRQLGVDPERIDEFVETVRKFIND